MQWRTPLCFGVTPEHKGVLGKVYWSASPPDLNQVTIDNFRKGFKGEANITFESEYNGIHYLSSLAIQRGGQIVEVISSWVENTNCKHVQDAQSSSEQEYHLIPRYTFLNRLM